MIQSDDTDTEDTEIEDTDTTDDTMTFYAPSMSCTEIQKER